MYLLVIGLVAVIVAFLVAAFFSMRRGHDDEDEPARRPSVRDRIRSRGGDTRDRDASWDSGSRPRPPARRPAGRDPASSRRPGRDSGDRSRADRYDRAGYDQPRGYEPSSRGYGERTPIRGYDGQRAERTPSARRSARYDDATETVVRSAARPARSSKAAPSARPGGDDSFGTGPVTALYDTGPSGAASADYPTGQVNADPDLADSDVFPRVREDIPRPASKARQRTQPKTRSGRPSRKHDDDDDWPSTEWDKLSDEQYWAELSADKPLATTARSAQSSRPAAAKPARGQAVRPTATPRPDRDRAAAGADRTDRTSSTGTGSRRSRDRAGQDDATQQLDARAGSRSGSRPPAARPRGAQAAEAAEAGDRDTRAAGSRPAGRSGRPAPAREYETTERMPSRSRSRAAAEIPSGSVPVSATSVGTGPMNAVPVSPGPISTGPLGAPIGAPVGAPVSTGPASPAPRRPAARGPAADDPLTSPAYARDTSPGGDGRSYRGSGRTAPRDQPRAAGEPRGYPRGPARGDYPDTGGRPGYPAAGGERTDPNASRPAASAGYLASPPPARSSYDDGRPAETTSPQAGAGNPYGSFVDSAPPPRPEPTGPSYPPATPGTGSRGSYGTGPTGSYGGQAGYPDPYGPGRDGYPAAAGHGSQDQGGTYYSAPPAAPAQPAAAYPYPASSGGYQDSPAYQNGAGYPDSGQYQNGSSYQGTAGYQDSTVYQNGGGYPESNDYPGSNGYSASNGQPGYGSGYVGDSQQNARYPGSPGTDPYGPDGYGGYHSRQG